MLHVAVPHGRPRIAPKGVRIHQMVDLAARVQWNTTPPSTRYDDTVLDLASRGTALCSVARLADACGNRRTTASRLRDRLDARPRVAQRAWLRTVLSDVADGTCSVLEYGYLDLGTRLTVRLSFGQVYDRPCGTAAKLGLLMQRLGWSGSPTRCELCRAVA